MFKPTNILQKSQARLRGQRGPAIRILRKAIRTVNPDAVKPAMLMPEHAKSPTTAWKELGTPIDKVMPEYNRGRQLPEFARDPNSEQQQGLLSWQSAAQKDLAIMRQSSDGNVPAVIKQKEQRIEVPFAAQGRVSSSYPAGYKAPPTLHWNHSVYAFNKNTLPLIPATSTTARRMIRLYYNMIPRNFKDVLGPQLSRPRYLLRSTFRAFVGDRMKNKMPVDPDIMSRIQPKRRGRMGFWHPLRKLSAIEPNTQFKHYSDKVNIATFVYDRRIQALRYRMAVLGRRISRVLSMSPRTGWATFGRNCDSWEHWQAKCEEAHPGKPSAGGRRRVKLAV